MNEEVNNTMKTNSRQITIIYRESSFEDKKTMAVAKDYQLPVREINIDKDNLTGTQLLELASYMGVDIKGLIRTDHPEFNSNYKNGNDFNQEDWIKIIQKNPIFLKTPIAFRGKEALLVETPTDLLKLNKTKHD